MRLQCVYMMVLVTALSSTSCGSIMSCLYDSRNQEVEHQARALERNQSNSMAGKIKRTISSVSHRNLGSVSNQDFSANYDTSWLHVHDACPICQVEMLRPGNHHRLTCGHAVCVKCWDQFVRYCRIQYYNRGQYRCPFRCIAYVENISRS